MLPVIKKVLGRQCRLGSLYDMRRDEFKDDYELEISVISSESFEFSNNSVHHFEPTVIKTLENKFELLEVNDDLLSLNVIAGLLIPCGSARYLLE